MMTTDSPSDPVDPAPAAQAGDGGAGPLDPVPYDPALDELAGLPAEQVIEKKQSRAGRNLPAAIAVGVGLGILIVATLLIRKESFITSSRSAWPWASGSCGRPCATPPSGPARPTGRRHGRDARGPPSSTARPASSWPGP